MKTLRKLFFEIKMTWLRVVVLAVASAMFTAAMLILPFTKYTSLADVGVNLEFWILCALVVIINCEKPVEAGLKVCVFFLISQPLIYLLQVPFSPLGWELFEYYPRWFIYTVLCLPGGMLAWFVKKDNVAGALILSAATSYLCFQSFCYFKVFPRHALSAFFCAVLAVLLIFVLLKDKKAHLVAVCVTLALALLLILVFGGIGGVSATMFYDLDDSHVWSVCSLDGDYIGEIDVTSDYVLRIEAERYGTETVVVVNENSEEIILVVSYYSSSGIDVKPVS